MRRFFSAPWFAVSVVLGLNVIFSAGFGGDRYLINLRYFKFPAQNPFKPLVLLNVVLLCAFLFVGYNRGPEITPHEARKAYSVGFPTVLTLLVVLVYLPSISINFWDHDWTQRHSGADLISWRAIGDLFFHPQVDGMYRPLAFLSFALDYQLFGLRLWGYHLQSIALHLMNSFLVLALGLKLGLNRSVSRISAVVFAVAAIHCEAVVWPAARFDLLACALSIISLLLFIGCWTERGIKSAVYGFCSLIAFILAVLNKETAYALLLVIPVLMCSGDAWKLPRPSRIKERVFTAGLLTSGAALIGIRFAVFGNLGGYGYGTNDPTVQRVSLKSLYLLGTNVAGLTPFALKVSHRSMATFTIVLCYVCLAAALARFSERSGPGRSAVVLGGLALLSALPTLPVIGWIKPSLENSRHLYLPSIWIALLMGSVLRKPSVRPAIIGLYLTVQVAALAWNTQGYKAILSLAKTDAASVEADIRRVGSHPVEIRLVNVPAEIEDVSYFDTELQHQLEITNPRSVIRLCPTESSCGPLQNGAITYTWETSEAQGGHLERSLTRP